MMGGMDPVLCLHLQQQYTLHQQLQQQGAASAAGGAGASSKAESQRPDPKNSWELLLCPSKNWAASNVEHFGKP